MPTGHRAMLYSRRWPPAKGRKRSFWAGGSLLLAGVATIGLVFYLGDTSEPVAEHIYFALGLTGMAFLSLAGQLMGVIGLVLLWHWWRRTPG